MFPLKSGGEQHYDEPYAVGQMGGGDRSCPRSCAGEGMSVVFLEVAGKEADLFLLRSAFDSVRALC